MSTLSYEPYAIEVPAGVEGEESTLKRVVPAEDGTGWHVTNDQSLSFFIPALPVTEYGRVLREPVEPKEGDTVTTYGGGLGSRIRGIAVNGTVVFYRDAEQEAANMARWRAEQEANRRRVFVIKQEQMDADYAALPGVFRSRIDRFRAGDPNFRVESERYEVFCLTEAVKIADYYDALDQPVPVPAGHQEFGDLWDALTAEKVASDGHSNNTFSGALVMARALAKFRAGEEVSV